MLWFEGLGLLFFPVPTIVEVGIDLMFSELPSQDYNHNNWVMLTLAIMGLFGSMSVDHNKTISHIFYHKEIILYIFFKPIQY